MEKKMPADRIPENSKVGQGGDFRIRIEKAMVRTSAERQRRRLAIEQEGRRLWQSGVEGFTDKKLYVFRHMRFIRRKWYCNFLLADSQKESLNLIKDTSSLRVRKYIPHSPSLRKRSCFRPSCNNRWMTSYYAQGASPIRIEKRCRFCTGLSICSQCQFLYISTC
jgi:hypothetical protein